MSDKQQRRADILQRAISGEISREQACTLLCLKDRQLRRAIQKLRTAGLSSLVHGNSGRAPANKTSAAIREELAALAGPDGVYHDFNTCHLKELLAERNQIAIGRSTLDRLLYETGVRKRKRSRSRRVFGRRERMAKEGEMLLTDGSQHDWLEGRDPRFEQICLLGAIDDATGKIKHLRFWQTECQAAYITMAREVTVAFGIPASFYHDRHTILASPKEQTIDDELARLKPMSQFEEILKELGAESIKATTPQAKGRIERLWKTLQDRLIKEMRLEGIRTLEEANEFLPRFIERYNGRFGVDARVDDPAWVPAPDLDLPYYFAARVERTVKDDHTISIDGKTLSITRRRGDLSLAGRKVRVHTTPEGQSFVYSSRRRLEYTKLDGPLSRPVTATKKPKKQKPDNLRSLLATGMACRPLDTPPRTFSLSN